MATRRANMALSDSVHDALDVLKLIVLTLLLYPIMYALEVVTLALVLVVSLLLLLVLLFVYLWLESFLPWNDYYTKLLLMSYRLLFFSTGCLQTDFFVVVLSPSYS